MGYDLDKNEITDQLVGQTYCQAPIINFIPTKDTNIGNDD